MVPTAFTETQDQWPREIAIVTAQMESSPWQKPLVKAQRLASTPGAVMDDGDGTWTVRGDKGTYTVSAANCSCPSGQYRKEPCAHRTAMEIIKRCIAGGVEPPWDYHMPKFTLSDDVDDTMAANPEESSMNFSYAETIDAAREPVVLPTPVQALPAGWPAPRTVYQAIAQVASRIAQHGVPKSQTNQGQHFQFRGIDDIQNALAPLLAEAQLIILPSAHSRQVAEREGKTGGVMQHVTVCVDYTLVETTSGHSHTVSVYGEAMDSGDKATNKAMSAAYKYMAIQTFCIPVAGQDADADSPEYVQPKQAAVDLLKRIGAAIDAKGHSKSDWLEMAFTATGATRKDEIPVGYLRAEAMRLGA